MVLFCDKYLPQKYQDFKKKSCKEEITDIEEDCSVCDELQQLKTTWKHMKSYLKPNQS